MVTLEHYFNPHPRYKTMKAIAIVFGTIALLLFSCHKSQTKPVELPKIAYTDIEDTTVQREENMTFDFDKDGQMDVNFRGEKRNIIYSSLTQVIEVNPLALYGVSVTYGQLVHNREYTLAPGTPVFSESDWTNEPMSLKWKESPNFYFGHWEETKHEGYIGIRYSRNPGVCYGWARISLSDSGAVTLHEYAVNRTIDQPIYAGQKQ